MRRKEGLREGKMGGSGEERGGLREGSKGEERGGLQEGRGKRGLEWAERREKWEALGRKERAKRGCSCWDPIELLPKLYINLL